MSFNAYLGERECVCVRAWHSQTIPSCYFWRIGTRSDNQGKFSYRAQTRWHIWTTQTHTHTHKPARTTLAHRWRFDVTELYSLLVHFVKLNCAHLHPINQIHQTHSSMKWRRLVHTAAIKYCNEFRPTYDKSIIVRSALMESKIGVKNMARILNQYIGALTHTRTHNLHLYASYRICHSHIGKFGWRNFSQYPKIWFILWKSNVTCLVCAKPDEPKKSNLSKTTDSHDTLKTSAVVVSTHRWCALAKRICGPV